MLGITRCVTGLLHTMLYRAYNICSSYTSVPGAGHQEVFHLKFGSQKNSFSLFFIDKYVHKLLNSLISKCHQLKPSSGEKEVIISIEFLEKLSLQVKKQLTDIF